MNKFTTFDSLLKEIEKDSFNKEYKYLLDEALNKCNAASKKGAVKAQKQFVDDLDLLIQKGMSSKEAIKELETDYKNRTNIHKYAVF